LVKGNPLIKKKYKYIYINNFKTNKTKVTQSNIIIIRNKRIKNIKAQNRKTLNYNKNLHNVIFLFGLVLFLFFVIKCILFTNLTLKLRKNFVLMLIKNYSK